MSKTYQSRSKRGEVRPKTRTNRGSRKASAKKIKEPIHCEYHQYKGQTAKQKRETAPKKSLRGKPAGYEIVSIPASQPKSATKMTPLTVPKQKIEINQDLSTERDLDQDIHPPYNTSSKKNKFELQDQDGQKYLKYKSISGMDSMPRMRQPTPPKYDLESDSQDENANNNAPDLDCKSCMKYK